MPVMECSIPAARGFSGQQPGGAAMGTAHRGGGASGFATRVKTRLVHGAPRGAACVRFAPITGDRHALGPGDARRDGHTRFTELDGTG